MATMMRFAGRRGINVDQLAEWEYEDKRPMPASRKSAASSEAPVLARSVAEPPSLPGASEIAGSSTKVLRLTFTGGHQMECDGDDAAALHRYLCTAGSALT